MMKSAPKIVVGLTLVAGVTAGVLFATGSTLGALIAGIAAVWLAAIAAGKAQPWLGLLVSSVAAMLV